MKPISLTNLPTTKEFGTEKKLCDYIEFNIELFCRDVLEEEYKSHTREYRLKPQYFGRYMSPRVDFYVETDKGSYLVEVKNPSNKYAEQVAAIGQLLSYKTQKPESEMVFVSSSFLQIVPEIITSFELPITLAVVRKDMLATWRHNG